jgi:hypothetical protein
MDCASSVLLLYKDNFLDQVWRRERIVGFGEIVTTPETKKELNDSNKIQLTRELSE